MEISFSINTKPESMKEEFAEKLAAALNNKGYKTRVNHSYEFGIEFDLTSDWIDILCKDPIGSQYLKYHNARQLRFVAENGYIVAMRSKDCMPYFTKEELRVVQETFNSL